MALTDKLVAIADAIRGKTGGAEPLTLDQMATEIAGIQAGGGGGEGGDSGEIVLVPKTTFTLADDYTPYSGISIPDDIHTGTYQVYFDDVGNYKPKMQNNGKYGNPYFWMGSDDGTPFLLVAGEGIYAYAGTHTIRIIKVL